MKLKEMTMVGMLAGILVLAIAGCGGGGTPSGDASGDTLDTTGTIEGALYTDGIETHATSAASDGETPVAGAEVWCERTATGERLGEGRTDGEGRFEIRNMPAGVELNFKYRFRAQGDIEDIEGCLRLQLESGECKQLQQRVRQYDDNGDGICDRVENEGSDEALELRLRVRGESGQGDETAGEGDQTRDRVRDGECDPGDGEPGDGGSGEGDQTRDRVRDGECDPGDGEPGDGGSGEGGPGNEGSGDGGSGDGEPGDGGSGEGGPGNEGSGDGGSGDGGSGDGEPGDGGSGGGGQGSGAA